MLLGLQQSRPNPSMRIPWARQQAQRRYFQAVQEEKWHVLGRSFAFQTLIRRYGPEPLCRCISTA